MTLQDVYKSNLEVGLVDLEEGVAKHWSWNGRIVLVGDACHKFTPSTGAGCNDGMVDVVALVGKLTSSMSPESCLAKASAQVLSLAFQTYQDARFADVTFAHNIAAQATASATWQTAIHKFIDRRVISRHVLQKFLIGHEAAKDLARIKEFDVTQFSRAVQVA